MFKKYVQNQEGITTVMIVGVLAFLIIALGGILLISHSSSKPTVQQNVHPDSEAQALVQKAYENILEYRKTNSQGSAQEAEIMRPVVSDALYVRLKNTSDWSKDPILCGSDIPDAVSAKVNDTLQGTSAILVDERKAGSLYKQAVTTVDLQTLKITAITCQG